MFIHTKKEINVRLSQQEINAHTPEKMTSSFTEHGSNNWRIPEETATLHVPDNVIRVMKQLLCKVL